MSKSLTLYVVDAETQKRLVMEAYENRKPLVDTSGNTVRFITDMDRYAAIFGPVNLNIIRTIRGMGEPTYEEAMAALGYPTDREMIADFMERGILDLFTIGGDKERRTLRVSFDRIIFQIDL